MDQIGHGVHRVGHADDNSIGRVLEHVLCNRLDDACINTDKFFAGHAGFAGNSRCDYHNVGVGGFGVVVGHACQTRLQPQDISGLHDVHGFAFRNALFDVDENYFVGNLVVTNTLAVVAPTFPAPTTVTFDIVSVFENRYRC